MYNATSSYREISESLLKLAIKRQSINKLHFVKISNTILYHQHPYILACFFNILFINDEIIVKTKAPSCKGNHVSCVPCVVSFSF